MNIDSRALNGYLLVMYQLNKCFYNFLVGISDNDFFIDGINCIINNNVMEGLK